MKPRTWLFAVVAAALYVLFNADEALAWGAGTHVQLGTEMLARLGLLPASVAAVLARHAIDYLYGNVAADVVFAKRWSRVKQFCHHWTTGFRLLDRCGDGRGQAFALGYLSHLAADTVAHGKFIPRQLAVTGTTMNFGHLYWELRADSLLAPDSADRLEALARYDFTVHHARMAEVMTQTFLPYEVNLRVFERITHLMTRRPLLRSMGMWGVYSRWPLCGDLLRRYHDECLERMASVLSEQERSPVLHEDPNGSSALLQVRVHRRHVRLLRRGGLALDHLLYDAAASYAPTNRPATTA